MIGIPDNIATQSFRNTLSQCQLAIVRLWRSLFFGEGLSIATLSQAA